MMRLHPIPLFAFAAFVLLWPASAFAKRKPPSPVPPVVWQGAEYRAPVNRMGYVEAYEVQTGRKLWETKVYPVWIDPLAERDVQSVFISSMQVQDGKLLVRNENGKSYMLDLKTGRVEGAIRYWLPWFLAGLLLAVLAFYARSRISPSAACKVKQSATGIERL